MAKFITSEIAPPGGTGAQVGQLGIAKFSAEAQAVLRARALRQEKQRIDDALQTNRENEKIRRQLMKQTAEIAKERAAGAERRHKEGLGAQRDIAGMQEAGRDRRAAMRAGGEQAGRDAAADRIDPGPGAAAAPGGAGLGAGQFPAAPGQVFPAPAAPGAPALPPPPGPGMLPGGAPGPAPGAAPAAAAGQPRPVTEKGIAAQSAARAAAMLRRQADAAKADTARMAQDLRVGRADPAEAQTQNRAAMRLDVAAGQAEEKARALADIAVVEQRQTQAMLAAKASLNRITSPDDLRAATAAMLGSGKLSADQQAELRRYSKERYDMVREARERDHAQRLQAEMPALEAIGRNWRGKAGAESALNKHLAALQRTVFDRQPSLGDMEMMTTARARLRKVWGLEAAEGKGLPVMDYVANYGKLVRPAVLAVQEVDEDKVGSTRIAEARANQVVSERAEKMMAAAINAVNTGQSKARFLDWATEKLSKYEVPNPETDAEKDKFVRLPHIKYLADRAYDIAEAKHGR